MCDFCHQLLAILDQFLGLVHVFRHFMRFQKDIADQFYEIVIIIVGEKILGHSQFKYQIFHISKAEETLLMRHSC
jgi:hypothetical protein